MTESLRKNVDLDRFEKEEGEIGVGESSGGRGEGEEEEEEVGFLDNFEGLKDGSGELEVLDKVLEFGVKRLKGDVDLDGNEVGGSGRGEGSSSGGVVAIEEGEMMCLRKVILDNADVFDALCWNVESQMKGMKVENENSGMEITVRGEESEKVEEEGVELFDLIRKCVQLAHLDAMKECSKEGDEGVFSHIRFLHLDRGLEESEYRYVHFWVSVI